MIEEDLKYLEHQALKLRQETTVCRIRVRQAECATAPDSSKLLRLREDHLAVRDRALRAQGAFREALATFRSGNPPAPSPAPVPPNLASIRNNQTFEQFLASPAPEI